MAEFTLYDVSEGIATITLDNPEKLNAYNTVMGDEVVAWLRGARDDDAVRAVILTGAGRGFCAGVDLDHLKAHMAGGNAGKGPKLGEEDFLRKMPLEMMEYPKPIIAAINGHAIGVGMTMVLPCDIRIASEGAKLGLAFAKLGILPGLGSTHVLPRLVGMGRAMELLMTGDFIDAHEAYRIGLYHRVVPSSELMKEGRGWAERLAAGPSFGLEITKKMLYREATMDVESALAAETEIQAACMEDPNFREAYEAFMAKRAPKFE